MWRSFGQERCRVVTKVLGQPPKQEENPQPAFCTPSTIVIFQSIRNPHLTLYPQSLIHNPHFSLYAQSETATYIFHQTLRLAS